MGIFKSTCSRNIVITRISPAILELLSDTEHRVKINAKIYRPDCINLLKPTFFSCYFTSNLGHTHYKSRFPFSKQI